MILSGFLILTGMVLSKRINSLVTHQFQFAQVSEVFEANEKVASGNDQSPRDLWLRFQIEDTGIGMLSEISPLVRSWNAKLCFMFYGTDDHAILFDSHRCSISRE